MTDVGDYFESIGTSGDPEVAGRFARKLGSAIKKAHTAPFRLVMGFDNGQLVGSAPEKKKKVARKVAAKPAPKQIKDIPAEPVAATAEA